MICKKYAVESTIDRRYKIVPIGISRQEVLRGLSDFILLYQELRLLFPGIILPGLPEKHPVISNVPDSWFKESRRRGFEICLDGLLENDEICACEAINQFLNSDDFVTVKGVWKRKNSLWQQFMKEAVGLNFLAKIEVELLEKGKDYFVENEAVVRHMTNEVRSFEGKLEALKDAIKKYMTVRTSMANSSTCIIGKLEALGKCEESHVQERAAELVVLLGVLHEEYSHQNLCEMIEVEMALRLLQQRVDSVKIALQQQQQQRQRFSYINRIAQNESVTASVSIKRQRVADIEKARQTYTAATDRLTRGFPHFQAGVYRALHEVLTKFALLQASFSSHTHTRVDALVEQQSALHDATIGGGVGGPGRAERSATWDGSLSMVQGQVSLAASSGAICDFMVDLMRDPQGREERYLVYSQISDSPPCVVIRSLSDFENLVDELGEKFPALVFPSLPTRAPISLAVNAASAVAGVAQTVAQSIWRKGPKPVATNELALLSELLGATFDSKRWHVEDDRADVHVGGDDILNAPLSLTLDATTGCATTTTTTTTAAAAAAAASVEHEEDTSRVLQSEDFNSDLVSVRSLLDAENRRRVLQQFLVRITENPGITAALPFVTFLQSESMWADVSASDIAQPSMCPKKNGFWTYLSDTFGLEREQDILALKSCAVDESVVASISQYLKTLQTAVLELQESIRSLLTLKRDFGHCCREVYEALRAAAAGDSNGSVEVDQYGAALLSGICDSLDKQQSVVQAFYARVTLAVDCELEQVLWSSRAVETAITQLVHVKQSFLQVVRYLSTSEGEARQQALLMEAWAMGAFQGCDQADVDSDGALQDAVMIVLSSKIRGSADAEGGVNEQHGTEAVATSGSGGGRAAAGEETYFIPGGIDGARRVYEKVTKQLLRGFDIFKQRKDADLKKLFGKFRDLQVASCAEERRAWTVSPVISEYVQQQAMRREVGSAVAVENSGADDSTVLEPADEWYQRLSGQLQHNSGDVPAGIATHIWGFFSRFFTGPSIMSTIKSGEGKDLVRSSLESGGDFVNSELCRRMMQEMKALRIQKLQQEDRLLETVTRLSILQHDKGLLLWSIQPEILYSAQLPNFSHGRAGLGGLGGGTDQTDDEVTGSSETVGSSSSRRHSNTVHLYSISMASLSYQDTREMREFSVACQHFCRLLGEPVSSVRQVDVIEYVHPHEVTQRYQDQKRAFQLAGKNDPDIWTFHGSSDDGVRAIVQHGFKVGGVDNGVKVSNGNVYGFGVYTSTGPRDPMGYTRGARQLILATAVPGNHKVADRSDAQSDSWTPPSHLDWMIFKSGDQLLPCFVIHYS